MQVTAEVSPRGLGAKLAWATVEEQAGTLSAFASTACNEECTYDAAALARELSRLPSCQKTYDLFITLAQEMKNVHDEGEATPR